MDDAALPRGLSADARAGVRASGRVLVVRRWRMSRTQDDHSGCSELQHQCGEGETWVLPGLPERPKEPTLEARVARYQAGCRRACDCKATFRACYIGCGERYAAAGYAWPTAMGTNRLHCRGDRNVKGVVCRSGAARPWPRGEASGGLSIRSQGGRFVLASFAVDLWSQPCLLYTSPSPRDSL